MGPQLTALRIMRSSVPWRRSRGLGGTGCSVECLGEARIVRGPVECEGEGGGGGGGGGGGLGGAGCSVECLGEARIVRGPVECQGEWRVESGEWRVEGGEWAGAVSV